MTEKKNKKEFYYDPDIMELNKWGYPIYKNSKIIVHLYKAEKYLLKRKLRAGEVVHHVDGDKLNFDFNNLVVLQKEDHQKLERNIREIKNLNIAQGIILVLVFGLFSGIGNGQFTLFGKLVIFFLLFLGIMIPYYPRILRRMLFTLGILKKNKK